MSDDRYDLDQDLDLDQQQDGNDTSDARAKLSGGAGSRSRQRARRDLLRTGAGAALHRMLGASASGAAGVAGALLLPASAARAAAAARSLSNAHVVVIGAGYGGATAARYLRLWSDHKLKVTLIDRESKFISCPLSNLVLSGDRAIESLSVSYKGLEGQGVTVVHDEVTAIDTAKRQVRLKRGEALSYDRLVVAPGIDFIEQGIEGLAQASKAGKILHAWKAGPQTVQLREQIQSMPDGGVFAMSIPRAPYRCPPGPYERACTIASYLKRAKPKSRVLILDANEDVQSKKGLFTKSWKEDYAGIIEYRPNSALRAVDPAGGTVHLEFDDLKADVVNVIPPQRAAAIAKDAGLVTINDRWCGVDWRTAESTAVKGVHVIGDATFPAEIMPKSGHMANQHGKLAASAILAMLADEEPEREPMVMNTCYSFVDARRAMHVATVHRWIPEENAMKPVNGAGGLSVAASEAEGRIAQGWARTIWADMFA